MKYPDALRVSLRVMKNPLGDHDVANHLAPCLIAAWVADYGLSTPQYDIVETRDAAGFYYLFDIEAQRLIAAWGLCRQKDTSPRSIIASRMKGHPLTNLVLGNRYHRGHAIPHTMGGRTDINLVPQLGIINSGPFQRLERKAVDTPGCLYFTYWSYPNTDTQRPCRVQQGLLIGGSDPEFDEFLN